MAIGGCTIAELQARMGYAEFIDWLAFYQIEPFGGLRDDLGAALVASLIANANRDAKKHPAAFTLADFIPEFWHASRAAEAKSSQPSDLLAKFRVLTEGISNGRIG